MRYSAFLIALFVLGLSSASVAESPSFKVIVHPNNPITSIERDVLRNVFLKKVLAWHGGESVRPVELSSKFPVREQFTRKVLKKTPAQLKIYWNQQIFSGKGVPPPEVAATSDVVTYVLAHPGAIGYVPSGVDTRDAKVLEVK